MSVRSYCRERKVYAIKELKIEQPIDRPTEIKYEQPMPIPVGHQSQGFQCAVKCVKCLLY